MVASRKHGAITFAGALSLALVACDTLLGLGQYEDVACSVDCEAGLRETGGSPPNDSAPGPDVARMPESGVDADADADADSDTGVVTMPDSGWPVPTGHELWAHWPMPNPDASLGPESSTLLPNQMTFDAGAEGGSAVVFDAVTKLTWRRQAMSATTYDAAWVACGGGTDGWRVPSRIELVSLIDFTRTPTLDTTTFVDAGGAPTWTSSAVPGDGGPSSYWAVDFATGLTTYGGAPSQVLCVNGGTP